VPWAAWPKLIEVSKIYAPFLLTLWLINSREKLFYLIITIAASFGILAAKGGFWAILTGFAYRVYGPNGTAYADNNHFAIAVLMNVPLLVLWLRQTPNKWIRYALMVAIFLSVTAAVSSWSRGAMLTLGVIGLVLIWHSKRKYLAIPVLIAGAYWTVTQLPEQWFERMHTIQTYEEDGSAMSRLEVWGDGFDFALSHPFLGAGFEGWRYVTRSDWHSSYIEIMAEHGLIAFSMWTSLLFGTILGLTLLPRRSRGVPGMEWVANWSYMLRAALIAYAAGTVFVGVAYWDFFYHLVFVSVLLKKFALEELAERTSSHASGVPAQVYPATHSLATQPRSSPDT
jgi:probable O-glycosylation ligase (exosortase A-associated)